MAAESGWRARLAWVSLLFVSIMALLCGYFVSPAAAGSGGDLYVSMNVYYNQQTSKSATVPSGTNLQFVINWACNEAACTDVKVVVPFADGLSVGGSTLGTGWSESRSGNTVTFSRASIPLGTGGQLIATAAPTAFVTPDGATFSQTAFIQGTGSTTKVDTPVTVTSNAASTTEVVVTRTEGGPLESNTTYNVCAKINNAGSGPLGVKANSIVTVSIPVGATLVPDSYGDGMRVGNTIQWILPADNSAGCTDRSFSVVFHADPLNGVPGNSVGDSKTLSATWYGTKVGSNSQVQLGSNTLTYAIPPVPDSVELLSKVNLLQNVATTYTVNDAGSPTPPPLRGNVGEPISVSVRADNTSSVALDSLTEYFDIPDVWHVDKAAGTVYGSSAKIYVKINDSGDWIERYDLGSGNYSLDLYTADGLVDGQSALDPSDEVTAVKIVQLGPIKPNAGPAYAMSVSGKVRSTKRSDASALTAPDLGPVDEENNHQGYSFIIHHDYTAPGGAGNSLDTPEYFGLSIKPMSLTPVVGCKSWSTDQNPQPFMGDCGSFLPADPNTGAITRDAKLVLSVTHDQNLKDPVISLWLPDSRIGLFDPSFVPANWSFDGPIGSPMPSLPIVKPSVNYRGVIGTAYIWKWSAGTVIPRNQSGQWKITVHVKFTKEAYGATNGGGALSTAVFASSADPAVNYLCGATDWWGRTGADANDINANNVTTDLACSYGWDAGPTDLGAYHIEQQFKGQWDSDYQLNPSESFSTPGHVDSMKVSLVSDGTKLLTNGTLLVRLPRPDDKNYLTDGQRNPSDHTFPVNLAGAPTVDPDNKLFDQWGVGKLTAYWTTAANPCASDFGANVPLNCSSDPNDWQVWTVKTGGSTVTDTAPTNLADVTALKFVWDANKKLLPSDRFDAIIPVTTPTTPADGCGAADSTECEITYAQVNNTQPNDPAADERAVGTSLGVASPDGGSPLPNLTSAAATLRMPNVFGPDINPLTSVGDFDTSQTATVPVDLDGPDDTASTGDDQTATLLTCNPADAVNCPNPEETDTVTIPGVGTYVIDSSYVITFTPVTGFVGEATPVYFSVKNQNDQSQTATYTPVVRPPVLTTDDKSSTGVGTALQTSGDITVPDGGTLALIDPGTLSPIPGNVWTVPGQGTYTFDPSTASIVFEPELGFVGQPSPARFQVGDVYSQTVIGSYQPTVTLPAPPTATPRAKQVAKNGTTQLLITPPTGGKIELLQTGTPTSPLTASGQGQFAVDPATGVVTVTATDDYVGAIDPVVYRATDAYGQWAVSTITITTIDGSPDPSADNVATEGPKNTSQQVYIPTNDGEEVQIVSDGAHGTSTVEVDSDGKSWIVFTPANGYTGADQITYKVVVTANPSKSAEATYSVTIFDRPTPSNVVSAGAKDVAQTKTVSLATGESVKLVDTANGNALVNQLTIPGEGTYKVNPLTGKITFTPEAGYTGTGVGVTYRVTDANGHTGDATYVPTVVEPPSPAAKTSTGVQRTVQTITVTPPTGGRVKLLDSAANPIDADTLTIPGEGTYTIDPTTGVITFTPQADFVGAATAIAFRVFDQLDQSGDAELAVTVNAAPEPDPEQTQTPGPEPTQSQDPGSSDPGTPVPSGSLKPAAPGKVHVINRQKSKKVEVSWAPPANGNPVQWYRLTIIQRGHVKVLLVKRLASSKTSFTVKKSWLLKHSVRSRGDVRSQVLKYRVRVEAFNANGKSPVSTAYITLKTS